MIPNLCCSILRKPRPRQQWLHCQEASRNFLCTIIKIPERIAKQLILNSGVRGIFACELGKQKSNTKVHWFPRDTLLGDTLNPKSPKSSKGPVLLGPPIGSKPPESQDDAKAGPSAKQPSISECWTPSACDAKSSLSCLGTPKGCRRPKNTPLPVEVPVRDSKHARLSCDGAAGARKCSQAAARAQVPCSSAWPTPSVHTHNKGEPRNTPCGEAETPKPFKGTMGPEPPK